MSHDATLGAGERTPAPTKCERLQALTLSVAAIRDVDRLAVDQFHMHPLVLMENAAGNCARWLLARYQPASPRTVLLCGRGNNGGDGLVIARHLRLAGWQCEVFALGPEQEMSRDALANWQILTARSSPGNTLVHAAAAASADRRSSQQLEQALAGAELIIDAMLGTGARGLPRPPLDGWIELANAASATRIAIDIPTGLDAETGEVAAITFRAQHTLSFVAHKPGFHRPQARATLGEVSVLPIGIPVELIEQLLTQSLSSSPGGGS
jgi:NAD(P)H-hydrate epimerase